MNTLHNLKRLAVVIASCGILAGCTQVNYTIIIPEEGAEVVISRAKEGEEVVIENFPFELIVEPESQERVCR